MESTFHIVGLGHVNPDFFSRRIQCGIGAPYSHIGILVNGSIVYHATSKGFHISSLEEVLDYGRVVIRRKVPVPVSKPCCAITWLNARIGLKYSVLQYLGFIFPVLRFIPFVNNGRRETVCSEIGADFIAECSSMKDIASMAYGDCDWVDPKRCLDIAAGLYGEERGS
jgi:hypothetical protein